MTPVALTSIITGGNLTINIVGYSFESFYDQNNSDNIFSNTGNWPSSNPAISADGTKIAFSSSADNLVPGDGNGGEDIFVRDLNTGKTILASRTMDGRQSSGGVAIPSISDDRTKLVFSSNNDDLAPDDSNGTDDVFLKDLVTGKLTLISRNQDGMPGNGQSILPTISGDGRRVAFTSVAALVPKDGPASAYDIYVKDLTTGALILASETGDGVQANGSSFGGVISADGSHVGFQSFAETLSPDNAKRGTDRHLRRDPWPTGRPAKEPVERIH